MYAATLGVARVYLSHGVGYRYSSFQPIAGIHDDGRDLDRPHILPLYYGLLFLNEAIGNGTASRQVVELSTEHRHIASYGIYEEKKLRRIILVNSKIHKAGQHHREAVTVDLDGLSGSFGVKRLHIPHTTAQEGL